MSAHNPIYHLKDAYYFEVPKALWRQNWQALDEVPQFLRDGRPDITDVAEFNAALDGKILIPQPFGTLDSLYEKKTGFCISKYMILEVALAALLLFVFTRLASRLRGGSPPKGRITNLFEAMILFVRDQIARPAIDSHDHDHGHEDHGHGTARGHDGHEVTPAHAAVHAVLEHHDGDRFVPLLLTLFFFVLGCNLLGMVPWAGSPTASFSVTLALAGVTLATVVVAGMRQFGFFGFFGNQVPTMDLPLPLAIPFPVPVLVVPLPLSLPILLPLALSLPLFLSLPASVPFPVPVPFPVALPVPLSFPLFVSGTPSPRRNDGSFSLLLRVSVSRPTPLLPVPIPPSSAIP
jgi:F-type H+-transporting ATPase subunit a